MRRFARSHIRSAADPVLLLHGQPGSAEDWGPVRSAIDGRVRTIAPDRPGWDGRTGPSDLIGNARAAVSVLDRDEVQRATVVGHSLGAAVAVQLALEHPERVGALVLAAPSATRASLNRLDELLATPILGSALATGALAVMGMTLHVGAIRRRLTARLGLRESYLRRYARALLNPLTWHSFVVEQRMLVRELPVLETRLSMISAPTTIVIGQGDRIVTPSSARRLTEQIPGARLVALERATHLLVQERPAELADLIVEAANGGTDRDDAAIPLDQASPGSG